MIDPLVLSGICANGQFICWATSHLSDVCQVPSPRKPNLNSNRTKKKEPESARETPPSPSQNYYALRGFQVKIPATNLDRFSYASSILRPVVHHLYAEG